MDIFNQKLNPRLNFAQSSCPYPPDSCTDGWAENQEGPNPHILYGAMVGGPDEVGDLSVLNFILKQKNFFHKKPS